VKRVARSRVAFGQAQANPAPTRTNMPSPTPTWTDSAGVPHDLTTAKRLSVTETANRLSVSAPTVRTLVATSTLYPALRHRSRRLEIYECGLVDYIARNVTHPGSSGAT
jgi:hypothetical protein